jgi:hypothetical protein
MEAWRKSGLSKEESVRKRQRVERVKMKADQIELWRAWLLF